MNIGGGGGTEEEPTRFHSFMGFLKVLVFWSAVVTLTLTGHCAC